MGLCSSSASDKIGRISTIQYQIQESMTFPLEIQVAHYTPSSFPLRPIINNNTAKICAESWKKVVANNITDENGSTVSGITVFYSDFYDRLELFDSKGVFEAVLTRHASGDNKAAAKGAILLRIVNFMLAIEGDTPETQTLLFMLGKAHTQRLIRPWQYSIFVQTLLNTISDRLGLNAINQVMEAWVNLFAFVLQSMLPPAITGLVVETELNINTSSEFDNGKLAQEADAEMKHIKKKDTSDGASIRSLTSIRE